MRYNVCNKSCSKVPVGVRRRYNRYLIVHERLSLCSVLSVFLLLPLITAFVFMLSSCQTCSIKAFLRDSQATHTDAYASDTGIGVWCGTSILIKEVQIEQDGLLYNAFEMPDGTRVPVMYARTLLGLPDPRAQVAFDRPVFTIPAKQLGLPDAEPYSSITEVSAVGVLDTANNPGPFITNIKALRQIVTTYLDSIPGDPADEARRGSAGIIVLFSSVVITCATVLSLLLLITHYATVRVRSLEEAFPTLKKERETAKKERETPEKETDISEREEKDA